MRALGVLEPLLAKPWDYVQQDAEQRLAGYLRCEPDAVQLIVIVGAWHGDEVARMLSHYQSCSFICLEPNPGDYAELAARFRDNDRVVCLPLAASDVTGAVTFHLVERSGTSSLLAPRQDDPRLNKAGVIDVPASRLDDLVELRGLQVDCLWIDAQGAELRVLAGAAETLKRTRTLFLEVATLESSYQDGATMADLAAMLEPLGFTLRSLGTDSANGEGNSLWVRRVGA